MDHCLMLIIIKTTFEKDDLSQNRFKLKLLCTVHHNNVIFKSSNWYFIKSINMETPKNSKDLSKIQKIHLNKSLRNCCYENLPIKS